MLQHTARNKIGCNSDQLVEKSLTSSWMFYPYSNCSNRVLNKYSTIQERKKERKKKGRKKERERKKDR